MADYEKIGERIRERLLSLNYVRADGELDVERFGWDFRLGKTNLYNWLANKAVPFKDLRKLCDALQVSADWLLFGMAERDPKARPGKARRHGKLRGLLLALTAATAALLSPSGGSAQAHALPLADDWTNSPSYRKYRRLGMVPA